MNASEDALLLLPQRYQTRALRRAAESAEELRLRLGQPLRGVCGGYETVLSEDRITEQDLYRCLEKATGASLHTASLSLANGFVTFRGIRIGVCGTVSRHEDGRLSYRSLSSLALRIPRECRGVCDAWFERVRDDGTGSVVILSPPGGGKTTALRELIRRFSYAGVRVGLVDERMEIAAAERGIAQYDLGPHCDILSGADKKQGAMMLLRGMNPQIIAVDEITGQEDADALHRMIGCGVRLLATLHASDLDDLYARPLYRSLIEDKVFRLAVVIRVHGGKRSYELKEIGR